MILEGELGSSIRSSVSVNIRRLEYDTELAIAQAKKANMPELDYYVHEVKTAEYRGILKKRQQQKVKE